MAAAENSSVVSILMHDRSRNSCTFNGPYRNVWRFPASDPTRPLALSQALNMFFTFISQLFRQATTNEMDPSRAVRALDLVCVAGADLLIVIV